MLTTDSVNPFNLSELQFSHWQDGDDNAFLSIPLEELEKLHAIEPPPQSAALCAQIAVEGWLGLGLKLPTEPRDPDSNSAEAPIPLFDVSRLRPFYIEGDS